MGLESREHIEPELKRFNEVINGGNSKLTKMSLDEIISFNQV